MKFIVRTVTAMLLTLSPAFAQQAAPSAAGVDALAAVSPAQLSGVARASKLIGRSVYSSDVSIGRIEDLLIDLDHAKVTAVILSVGGFLGLGDKLVAVPVEQIKVGSEARFTSEMTRAQLTSAPAYVYSRLD